MQVNQNNIEAILKLAHYYYYGLKGLKQNFELSFKYFNKAAQLGDTSAKSTLGFFYLKGVGIEKNYKLAFDYYNQASLKSDARANNGLGIFYFLLEEIKELSE